MPGIRKVFALVGVALSLLAVSTELQAQRTSRMIGRVIDAQTGEGLSAVTIQVVGTGIAAISGLDGRYVLNGVPAGRVTLRATSIGYGVKDITGVVIDGNGPMEQNIVLETEAVQIGAIEVTAAAERGSVNRALDQQRTAAGIVNAITSEQITRSPDSDAAQAVQRVSGVTIQDGKFVVVRGLGERYTTTSLNGARIPSPEPEKKMVPLDLFPSGLIEQITTAKTFTPDQPGDFSGGQVDIKTREFPLARRQTVGFSIGVNGAVAGRTVIGPVAHGSEWLGFGARHRRLPTQLRSAGNFEQQFSQEQVNTLIRSLNNSWSGRSSAGRPNTSIGVSLGGNESVLGRPLGYVLAGSYSLAQEIRDSEVRALAFPTDDGGTSEIDRFSGATQRSSVLWGGIANFSALLGSSSRLALNTSYNRSADNEARNEIGFSDDDQFPLEIHRLRYVERSVVSGQLLGEHEVYRNHRLDWSLNAARVTRDEPDRSEFVYELSSDPVTGASQAAAWFAAANEGAVRTYAELAESSLEAKLSYRLAFGSTRSHALKLGGLLRATERTSDNRAYSITAPTLARADREGNAEQIIARFSQPGSQGLRITPLLQGGSYLAEDKLTAGYAQLELALGDKLRLIVGARGEHSAVEVRAEPTVGDAVNSNPSYTDVLPALSFNYALNEQQNLRLSASQTLSRPEYREMAPIAYRDVIGGDNVIGNAALRRSLIRNFDVRWELYPATGEVLSLALFAKLFKDPIERVYLGTSGTRVITFVNAEAATNYGAEVEFRRNLGLIAEPLSSLTLGANLTVMHSDIRIRGGGAFEDRRPMVSQAPYVLNAALTYTAPAGETSATLLYNVAGKRIHSAAEAPLPDVYEQARHAIDLALRVPLWASISAKLDIKNVLDSPHEVIQGSTTREYYNSGRVLSFGLNWRP